MSEIIRPSDLPAASSVGSGDVVPIDNGASVRKATMAQIVASGFPIASQAEAIAGVNNSTAMTPLRTKQAMESGIPALMQPWVDQAQAWAESSTPPNPGDPSSKSSKSWAELAESAADALEGVVWRETIAIVTVAGQQTYPLAYNPGQDRLLVTLNGQVLEYGQDYTISGASLTLIIPIVQGGDRLVYAGNKNTPDLSGLVNSLSFPSRAALVAHIALNSAKVGFTYFADGLSYQVRAGSAAIPDLPGLIPSGDIDAGHFGFDVGASGDVNRDAILRAVTYANGMKVTVRAPSDYQRSTLTTSSTSVNIEYVGPGKCLGSTWTIGNAYTDIQSVSSLTQVNFSLLGTNGRVTAIVVPDVSLYKRGDVMRIVSDDIDPTARAGYNARYGEDFEVMFVDSSSNTVYAAGWSLEFFDKYLTNVRVGLLPIYSVNIEGFKWDGVGTTTQRGIVIGPHYRPKVRAVFSNTGYVPFRSDGNIEGQFEITSKFNLVDYSILTYGVSEGQGARNTYLNLNVFGARHSFTTNYNSVAANSANLHQYGPPRDNRVIRGTSVASTNPAWDDHEGARRTTFIECETLEPHEGGVSGPSAFQARGWDMTILNCNTGRGFISVLRNNPETRGVTRIIGGRHLCPMVSSSEKPETHAKVSVENAYSESDNRIVSFSVYNGELDIVGGYHKLTRDGSAAPRMINAVNSRVRFIANPTFEFDGAGSSTRLCNLSNGSLATGKLSFKWNGLGALVGYFNIGANGASLDVDVDSLGGALAPMISPNSTGTLINGRWRLIDNTVTPSVVRESGYTLTSISAAPQYIGQFASVSGVGYMATGTASAADWKQVTA